MDRVPVSSSLIASVGHDPNTNVLEVEFNHEGAVYQYQNVDAHVFADMMVAESVGSYFTRNIKKRPEMFPFTRMNEVGNG